MRIRHTPLRCLRGARILCVHYPPTVPKRVKNEQEIRCRRRRCIRGSRPRHLTRGTIGHRNGRPVLRNRLGLGRRFGPTLFDRPHHQRPHRQARVLRPLGDRPKGKVRGYDVRYVTAVYTEGQGKRVPLAGAADLQIVVMAPAYSSSGNPTYNPSNWAHAKNVAGYTTFRRWPSWAASRARRPSGSVSAHGCRSRTFVLTVAGPPPACW